MKAYNLIGSLFILFVALTSCNSSPVGVKATGLAYEVVVSMDANYWESDLGQAVKDDLLSSVPALPQAEPSTRITYATPKDFNGLLTYVRNIVIVRINPSMYTKAALTYEYDRWSNGQVVIYLNAPDTDMAITYLKENERVMADFIEDVEKKRAADYFESNYSLVVHDNVKNKFNAVLKVPSEMTSSKDETGFFWASNNANTGRIDVVVYDFPYTDSNTFTVDYLVAKRDSVMKNNMPGSFPNSYMTTDTKYATVSYTPITLNGKYCGVMRGLWRMQGDMMGGPFVSHVRLDEINNRVVVVEGFVYAPETEKRNFIRRIEAALYTLRIPGDDGFTN
ncbi:DUF4837 family protein [Parabacteroides sp. OttesenSCG-928-G21]|nr:DUF4837 family protein [Parabacteroides sp. OttesenSCG-928-G21]